MDEVVIIGAGACGLMAARQLAEKKYSVTVVEARERSGGRIYTMHGKFPRPIEAGAEFMHGSQPLTSALIKASGCDAVLFGGDRFQLRNSRLEKGDLFNSQWEELTASLAKLKTDTDIASFLEVHFGAPEYDQLRENVTDFVEGFDAADPRQASALALREEWSQNDDEHQYHISTGYSNLTRAMEEQAATHGAKFVFSHPVREIHWRRGHVSVVTEPGKVFEARKAVITIPVGVLQQGRIVFSPSLPQHAEAFSKMGYGGVIKYFFQFNEPFWERSPGNIKSFSFIFSDAAIPTWWCRYAGQTPVLTGWLGGPATLRTVHDEELLYAEAVDSLTYIFGTTKDEVKERIVRWHIQDWVKDPWALGAYGYPTVKGRDATRFLVEPVQNTLYFAGEALYQGPAAGTVEAALVSGKEVAEKAAGDWL